MFFHFRQRVVFCMTRVQQKRKSHLILFPILPYVAAEYDTIHTVMCHFQDVLLQKFQSYDPLWCDEGVY